MTQQVYDHICRATKTRFPIDMWWDDAEAAASLNIAVQNEWVLRTSATQVEWTQKGVDAVKEIEAIRASTLALDDIEAVSGLLISLKDEIKVCTWDDVENCFPKKILSLDEDFTLWMESIKSQARQIYLLEKAGDKSENEASRAAIQFIHKKATAK